jgi:hypothetical protein
MRAYLGSIEVVAVSSIPVPPSIGRLSREFTGQRRTTVSLSFRAKAVYIEKIDCIYSSLVGCPRASDDSVVFAKISASMWFTPAYYAIKRSSGKRIVPRTCAPLRDEPGVPLRD